MLCPGHDIAERKSGQNRDSHEQASDLQITNLLVINRGHDDGKRPACSQEPAEHGFGKGVGTLGDQVPSTQSAEACDNSQNGKRQILIHFDTPRYL